MRFLREGGCSGSGRFLPGEPSMLHITSAKAHANNEVAFLAWTVAGDTGDCLGFEITRIYENEPPRVLPASVPFQGQSIPKWIPQTTTVWPDATGKCGPRNTAIWASQGR